ncbi:MAG TPA: hypothetical protein PLD56_12005 [Chitinophagales bacterium]|nr:hypothetical protein [Chitinophagales bacterium]
MKNEIEQQIFEKMKAKDFGESMCNETKLNVLKWTMQQLRKHDVSGSLPTDEDISKKAQEARVDDINDSINRVGGFIVGATWMRDLLKGNDR